MKYPSYEALRKIHKQQILQFGGDYGIRDENLLKSAHQQPLQPYGGQELYPTILEKSATLGFGIVKNHPFVDGNKRTGAAAMILLLELNGYSFQATNDELANTILNLAGDRITKDELTDWLKSHTAPSA